MTTRFAIVSSTGCCGFILQRRKQFEAIAPDAATTLGLFDTEDEAVATLTKHITAPHVETSL